MSFVSPRQAERQMSHPWQQAATTIQCVEVMTFWVPRTSCFLRWLGNPDSSRYLDTQGLEQYCPGLPSSPAPRVINVLCPCIMVLTNQSCFLFILHVIRYVLGLLCVAFSQGHRMRVACSFNLVFFSPLLPCPFPPLQGGEMEAWYIYSTL